MIKPLDSAELQASGALQEAPMALQPCRQVAQACAAIAGGLALLAGMGWWLKVRVLTGEWGGYIPMAPSTAIGIGLLSGVLAIAARGPRQSVARCWVWGAIALVACLALQVAIEFTFAIHWGTAVSARGPWPEATAAGSMSPLSALVFLLESGALALLLGAPCSGRAPTVAACLTILAVVIGMVILVGYAYGLPLLYDGSVTPMALPTVLAFLAVGVGELCLAVPRSSVLRAWTGDSMRGRLLRAFLPATLLITLVDGWADIVWEAHWNCNPVLGHCLLALAAGGLMVAVIAWTARQLGDALARAQDGLRVQKENLSAIFAASPVGMLLLDEDSMIVDANGMIGAMVLKEPSEIIGQREGGGLGCVHSAGHRRGCGFSAACRDCPLRKGVLEVLHSDTPVRGAEIQPTLRIGGREARPWLRVNADPVWLNGRKHVIVTVDDITEERQIREELMGARRELENRVEERTAALTIANATLQSEIAQSLRIQEALQASEARLREVMDMVPHMIFAKDRDGRFLLANRAMAEGYGMSVEQLLRNRQGELHPDALELEHMLKDDREVIDSGKPKFIAEETYLRWDGDRRVLETIKIPYMASGTTTPAMLGVAVDITLRKRAEEALRQHEETLHRSAVAAMERVLGVVAHELRTPLAALRAISEVLLDTNVRQTAEFDTFLGNINQEAIHMAETVNGLLEAAHINSGKAHWSWGEVALAEICEGALATIRPLVDCEHIALTLQVTPAAACMKGDAHAIQRLMVNLLANAQKYTQRGQIAIRVRSLTQGGEVWVEIQVRDTGAGIPAAMAPHLGEAFALNSGIVGANHIKGTGLGLAICKAIVAVHGGTLMVHSAVGEGTTITARLRTDLPGPVEDQIRVGFVENLCL